MKSGILFILGLSVVIFASALIHDVYAIGIEVRDEKGQLVSSVGGTSGNPFEFGIWAFPLITVNLILLAVGIMYYKGKLPNLIKKSIRFIFNFDVSAKIACAVVIGLLAIYIGFTINEIEHSKEVGWGDYLPTKQAASEYTVNDLLNYGPTTVRLVLLSISLNILENIRILPFIASIALLILTYFFTVKITQKRFSGIVSMVVLLQSRLFLEYDETATYENFWTLFYLLSLYAIYKKWYLSPISFILSLSSKPLSIIFLPTTFMFIYNSNLSKKKKTLFTISYLLIAVLVMTFFLTKNIWIDFTIFDYKIFVTGFKALGNFLRFDGLIIMFLLPLIIGLFLTAKKGIAHANSIMFLIFSILASAPFLSGITTFTNQPYRFVPLVVFFAIGVGILLSKRTYIATQNQKRGIFQNALFVMTFLVVSLNLMFIIFPNLISGSYRLILGE